MNYTLYNIIIYAFIFSFGITIGSFLNVCIYRLPKDESIISKPSHCMNCNNKIKPYDLIPIFSWIILKGKCRYCKQKIPFRYPLVELLNGLMYIISFICFGLTIKAVIMCVLYSLLIVVAFMDWDTMEINVGVIVFIALLSIPSYLLTTDATLIERLIGMIIISIPFLIICLITNGIGLGDVLLMGAAGLVLGYKVTLASAFIGIIIASIAGVTYKIITKSSKFAFGPYLAIAIAISTFYGDSLVNWYLKLLF